eukprot:9332-Pleurochrysis_carterae.AAC.4
MRSRTHACTPTCRYKLRTHELRATLGSRMPKVRLRCCHFENVPAAFVAAAAAADVAAAASAAATTITRNAVTTS